MADVGGAGVSTTTHNLFYFGLPMGHTSVLTCLLRVHTLTLDRSILGECVGLSVI